MSKIVVIGGTGTVVLDFQLPLAHRVLAFHRVERLFGLIVDVAVGHVHGRQIDGIQQHAVGGAAALDRRAIQGLKNQLGGRGGCGKDNGCGCPCRRPRRSPVGCAP